MREVLVNDMETLERRTADVALIHIGDQKQLHFGGQSVAGIGDGAQVGINHASHLEVRIVGTLQVSQVRVVGAGDGLKL